jgi:hypothetical protein
MSDNHIDVQKPGTDAGNNAPGSQPCQDRGFLKCAENGKGYYIHEDGRVEEINDIHFLKRLAWMPIEPNTQDEADKNDH